MLLTNSNIEQAQWIKFHSGNCRCENIEVDVDSFSTFLGSRQNTKARIWTHDITEVRLLPEPYIH